MEKTSHDNTSSHASENISTSTSFIQRGCRNAVLGNFNHFTVGCLCLTDQFDSFVFGDTNDQELRVELRVHNLEAYSQIVLGGSIGAAEAFMDRHWTSSDLTTLVRILVRNQHVLENMEGGFSKIGGYLHKFIHLIRRNNKHGSKRNIAAHYDLGNDFYKLFLDDTMMYSSALFRSDSDSLLDASTAKLDLICQKLQLNENDHVIEIGTGWGGFAIHAAQHYGCRVTTTTISQQQHDFAKEKIASLNLEDRITLLQEDYRDLEGRYTKLVSIEMIEAVGHQYYKQFFKKCSELLEDNGRMLIQAITINEQRYEEAKNEVDFIQRYIFPGGSLPSNTAIQNGITQHTDMRLVHMQEIGISYAKTLERWRETFLSKRNEVKEQGFSDTFVRMWEYYFCYCEGGFLERSIGCSHLVYNKPYCQLPDLANL